MSTNQLLPAQDLTLNCRLASRFSIVESSNRQMLPNRVSARPGITASSGIAPDRMYTAGSATVCGKDRICFKNLLSGPDPEHSNTGGGHRMPKT